MRGFLATVIVALIATDVLRSEIPEGVVLNDVRGWINGQIGESGAWDDSLSGGYLFRFSADVWGDSTPEDFLANSSGFSRGATWLVFSKGRRIGWLRLSGYEFLVIREGEVSIFPSGGTSGGFAGMSVQTWDETGIKRESREVHHEELGEFLKDWKARGQVIRPQLEMLRLVDYLQGSRDWEPVDLTAEEVEFRGNTGAIILKRDIERLETLNLRPEQALEMFERMLKPAETTSSSEDGTLRTDTPSLSTSIAPAKRDERIEGQTNRSSPRPWLAVAFVLIAVCAVILLVSRLRRPQPPRG